jgi:DNA-binding HxlR family transcriptional regulator
MIDFDQLDKLIHEKSRLSIMTLLSTRGEWAFQDLKTELGMSDGNLITHLRTLGDRRLRQRRPRRLRHPPPHQLRAHRRWSQGLQRLHRSPRPS